MWITAKNAGEKKMTHRYYEQDHDMGNFSRMEYFDNWFKANAQILAREKGMTLSDYLAQMKNFTSFKAMLQEVFSLDASLSNYVDGFSQRSFRLFYDRPVIQDIIEANKMEDGEFFEGLEEEAPVSVEQVQKEVVEFFRGTFIEKETGKTVKVIAKKDSVKVKGKSQVRYRDSRGRFVKKA